MDYLNKNSLSHIKTVRDYECLKDHSIALELEKDSFNSKNEDIKIIIFLADEILTFSPIAKGFFDTDYFNFKKILVEEIKEAVDRNETLILIEIFENDLRNVKIKYGIY